MGFVSLHGSEIHRNFHKLQPFKGRIEQLQLRSERAALRISADRSQTLNYLLGRQVQVGILDLLEVPFVQLHHTPICLRELLRGKLEWEFAHPFDHCSFSILKFVFLYI
jgi:hypothetical protein